MRHLSLIVLLGFLSILSCRDNGVEPPPPHIPTIALSAQSVAVTEAQLRVHFTDSASLHSFSLFRDRQFLLKGLNVRRDTVISDTTLLRGRYYTYKAYRLRDSVVTDSSKALTIHTIDSASIQLHVEPFVTDAAVEITINDRNPIREYQVVRDGHAILGGNLQGPDTSVIDSGLLPLTDHSYKVFRLENSIPIDSSLVVMVKTMDTTSHDFTWEIDTIGAETSNLNDVAILSDNSIWVVGVLVGRDSTGQVEPQQYNLATWDGSKWTLKRAFLPVCNPDGSEAGTAPFECNAICSFGPDDIWLTSGGEFVHWNGSVFERMCLVRGIIRGGVVALWGTSDQDLYGVGRQGTVIHYNGLSWQAIVSGTDVDLLDVWGTHDGDVVWACGWRDFYPTVLLKIKDGRSETVYNDQSNLYNIRSDSLSGGVQSVWTDNQARVFALAWYSLYRCPADTKGNGQAMWNGSIDLWGANRVRGTAINNVVVVGENGGASEVWHFNGMTWKRFDNLSSPTDYLYSVAITDNEIVAVGQRYLNGVQNYGLVYRGRR